ncbi:MAG: hypothetical protein LKE37_05340 [Atopobiaceae bacterium]|nr:hypothetical protein [Atopobiaceae bacterium]
MPTTPKPLKRISLEEALSPVRHDVTRHPISILARLRRIGETPMRDYLFCQPDGLDESIEALRLARVTEPPVRGNFEDTQAFLDRLGDMTLAEVAWKLDRGFRKDPGSVVTHDAMLAFLNPLRVMCGVLSHEPIPRPYPRKSSFASEAYTERFLSGQDAALSGLAPFLGRGKLEKVQLDDLGRDYFSSQVIVYQSLDETLRPVFNAFYFRLDWYEDALDMAYYGGGRLRRFLEPYDDGYQNCSAVYADVIRACAGQEARSWRLVPDEGGKAGPTAALHALFVEPIARARLRFNRDGSFRGRCPQSKRGGGA